MTTPAPHVVLEIPEGWRETPLAPPDLSQAAGVRVLTWKAWAPKSLAPGTLGDPPNPPGIPTGTPELVAGCFGSETGTWTAEAEPLVLERLRAMVSSTALRVARVGEYRVAESTRRGHLTTERLEGTGDERPLAAQVSLGFVHADAAKGARAEPMLVGCFALCSDRSQCEKTVEGATVAAEFVPPPGATLSLQALVTMVHHPSASLAVAVSCSLLMGAVLVITRRRPRTK